MNHLTARRLVYNESFVETITIPLRIFFQGEDDNPKYFDGRLNPYLLFFPLAAFLGLKKLPRRLRHENVMLAAFAVLYLLFAFVQTDMRIRYVAPIIGPLVILSVLGIRNLAELARSPTVVTQRLPGLTVAAGRPVPGSQPGIYPRAVRKGAAVGVLVGPGESRRLHPTASGPSTPLSATSTSRLPADAKVLGVFLGNRRYYCDRTLVFDGTLEAGLQISRFGPGPCGAGPGKGLLAHRDRCGACSITSCCGYPARRARGLPGVSGRSHAHPVRPRRPLPPGAEGRGLKVENRIEFVIRWPA